MAEVRESSGLTSLAALREQETRRIMLQTEAARARAEAEQRARMESERELARLERERQRLERAATDSREVELSRLEAARASELERAERAKRAREELQVLLAEERGARHSAELTFTAQLLRQRSFALLSAALGVVSWLGGAALYLGALRPQAERAALAAEHSVAVERQARVAAEESTARSARRNDELARRVGLLEQELRDQVVAGPSHTVQGVPQKSGQKSAHGLSASQPPCRDDGDPLNPCLKH